MHTYVPYLIVPKLLCANHSLQPSKIVPSDGPFVVELDRFTVPLSFLIIENASSHQ